jgi:hypothetical protein
MADIKVIDIDLDDVNIFLIHYNDYISHRKYSSDSLYRRFIKSKVYGISIIKKI